MLILLTAAKCLHKYERAGFKRMNKADFSVILGSHDLTNPSERGRLVPTVSDIKIHPSFKIDSFKNDFDIAVIVFAEPVTFTRYIKSINLIDEGSDEGKINDGKVASYGYKENRKLTAKSAPKELNTTIWDGVSCLLHNQAIVLTSGMDTFCINEKSSDRVCIEDIGSGLFIKFHDYYYLRGIASTLISVYNGICDINSKMVYTDISKYAKWIGDAQIEDFGDDYE